MAVGVELDHLGPVAEKPPAQEQIREVDVDNVHEEVQGLTREVLKQTTFWLNIRARTVLHTGSTFDF